MFFHGGHQRGIKVATEHLRKGARVKLNKKTSGFILVSLAAFIWLGFGFFQALASALPGQSSKLHLAGPGRLPGNNPLLRNKKASPASVPLTPFQPLNAAATTAAIAPAPAAAPVNPDDLGDRPAEFVPVTASPTPDPFQPRVFLPGLYKPLPFQEMITIPAGPFWMGCDPATETCNYRQSPLHKVTLSVYEMDRYEVTNARYQECVEAGACSPPRSIASFTRPYYYGNPLFASYPVMNVDWYQAAAFCSWAGRRLPTEAEWEKAARGDDGPLLFPWGSAAPTCTLANLTVDSGVCVGDTTPVDQYPQGASPYGLLDMAGNSWEWVADWFGDNYYSSYPVKGWPDNPLGPASGTYKAIRSGAWDLDRSGIRTSRRQWGLPAGFDTSTGFRCARSQ